MIKKIPQSNCAAKLHTFFIHKTFDKKIDNPNIKYLPFLLTVIKTARR